METENSKLTVLKDAFKAHFPSDFELSRNGNKILRFKEVKVP
jgi:hypothetical protein